MVCPTDWFLWRGFSILFFWYWTLFFKNLSKITWTIRTWLSLVCLKIPPQTVNHFLSKIWFDCWNWIQSTVYQAVRKKPEEIDEKYNFLSNSYLRTILEKIFAESQLKNLSVVNFLLAFYFSLGSLSLSISHLHWI